MSVRSKSGHWPVRCPSVISLGVILQAAIGWQSAQAQEPVIVRVEEDWEMVVVIPDGSTSGPQLVCAVSPTGNLDSLYATLEINHRTFPSYSPGGLHLQVLNGESTVATRSCPNSSLLSTAEERVQWTMRMEVQDGLLTFEVLNGHSTTWGEFGGDGTLKASVSAPVSSLNAYLPSVSVQNSGVTFAANRVQGLVLKSIRAYLSDGSAYSVITNTVVHENHE